MKHAFSKIIIIGTLTIIVLFVVGFFVQPTITRASDADNVTGWALSDAPTGSDQIMTPGNSTGGRGLGWISLNSINANAGGGTYGINLDPITGQFSGKAWSEYGGWVDFNPSGPYPTADMSHGASVDPACLAETTACTITGWIRFISGSSDSANPTTGGWDGWVKMSGIIPSRGGGIPYGVRLSAPVTATDGSKIRTFSGYAWGDRVVGWVDFQWATVKLLPNRVLGCMDNKASNYNPLATVDDGSCTYLCPTPNPDPNYIGMTGYNDKCPCKPRAGHPEDCSNIPPPTCPTPNPDPNYIGMTGYNDKCPCKPRPGKPSDCAVISGCTDPSDPNYNPEATIDDGTCQVCTPQSPSYNWKLETCASCNPTTPGWVQETATCPKGPKKPTHVET